MSQAMYNRIFGNFLSSVHITPVRLANCAQDSINRFTGANPGGVFNDVIAALTPAYDALRTEVTDVYQAGAARKGKTFTLDQMLDSFRAFMKDEEPFLARALGGRNTAKYIELYPDGIEGYTRAPKKDLSTRMGAVGEFAAANAAALGSAAAVLQDYAADWTSLRDAQQTAKGEVDENIAQRSAAREALELALLSAIHAVGEEYPGDVEKGKQYFDFTLLYRPGYFGTADPAMPQPGDPGTPDNPGGGTDQ